jgi:hypothetical protein
MAALRGGDSEMEFGSGGGSTSGLYCCPVSSLESSVCDGECREYNVSTCASLGTMVINGITVPSYKECVPATPPQTSVNVSSTTGGTVNTQGSTVGTLGRQFTATASPAAGYRFVRWEVSSQPVTTESGTVTPTQIELQEFSVASNVGTFDLVCPSTYTEDPNFNSFQQLSQVLYTDGSRLYSDRNGNIPAQIGYYGVGNGFYFNYTGAGVPTIQQCPIVVDGETTGGTGVIDSGGGGGEGDTRLTEGPTDFTGTSDSGGIDGGVEFENPGGFF